MCIYGVKMGKQENKDKARAKQRGEDRKKHFESGGSLSEWRGKHSVHTSKADKRNSRASDSKFAINEFLGEDK